MRGVLYGRYSPGSKQTEMSIEGQFRAGYKFADDNNIQIVNTYADRKATGRNDRRSDFQKMLSDSKKHLFECVIVWKIDRFGRNREEIAKNKAILRMNGVKVFYVDQSIPDGPEGIILESVLEGLAEYYSVNLSHDVMRGMEENALKCQHNGSVIPLGYSVNINKKYIINAEEESVVRMIFEMFDSGESITNIMRSLSNKGIKHRGKDFTFGAISRILKRRAYIGEYSWGDVIVPSGMPQIIDSDLFERVQKKMDLFKKAPAAKRSEVIFLLTGKLFCGKCKGTMAGDYGTSRSGERHYYYTCTARKKRRACTKKSVKKEWLEPEVTRLTVERILQPGVLEYIADQLVALHEKEVADASMLKYYTERLKETNAAIKNIMNAIEAGIFTDTTRDRLIELEEERDTYAAEIEKEKAVRPAISREKVLFFLDQFRGGDIHDKKYQERVVDAFVNKVILYEDKIIITYNHSDENTEVDLDVIEEAAFSAENTALCSTSVSIGPPKQKTPDRVFFVLR